MSTLPDRRTQGRIVAGVIAVCGFIFGTYRLLDTWSFVSRAQEATGVIVARDTRIFTIQYEVAGQSYQIDEDLPSTKGMSGLTRMRLQVGTPVPVLYDPSSPEKAKWKDARLWVFPLAVLAVSVIAAFCSWVPDVMFRPFRSG